MKEKLVFESVEDILKPKSKEDIEKEMPGFGVILEFIKKLNNKLSFKRFIAVLEKDEYGWFINIYPIDLYNAFINDFILFSNGNNEWEFKENKNSKPTLLTSKTLDDALIEKIFKFI